MVAIHEAAHAVMAMRNGYPIIEVSIIPTGDRFGYCHHSGGISRSEIQSIGKVSIAGDLIIMGKVLRSLEVTLAGDAAEDTEVTLPLFSRGSESDKELVFEMMAHPSVEYALDRYFHKDFDIWEHVGKIVAMPSFQDKLELISQALINHSVLSGEDIDRLLVADAGLDAQMVLFE